MGKNRINTEMWEKMGKWFDWNKVSHSLRSAIISTTGKILHLYFSWWDKSLENTAKWYIKKTQTQINIDNASKEAIQKFITWWKWIIISNHQSGNFSDYLPLFSIFWDKVLKNGPCYTGIYNFNMNKREFPEYTFRPATMRTIQDGKDIINYIDNDTKYLKNTWWFLFELPSWAETSEEAEFQGIFRRIITKSDEKLPILVNKISYKEPMGYKDVLLSLLGKKKPIVTIKTKLELVKDWKDISWKAMSWKEMRERYNNLFKQSH